MTKAEFQRRVTRLLRRFQNRIRERPKPKVRRVRVKEHWRRVPAK